MDFLLKFFFGLNAVLGGLNLAIVAASDSLPVSNLLTGLFGVAVALVLGYQLLARD